MGPFKNNVSPIFRTLGSSCLTSTIFAQRGVSPETRCDRAWPRPGGRAPASARLFHGRQDDAAQDDALAEQEDGRGGEGDQDEAREGHPRHAGEGLAHLVEPDRERPVALALADEEGPFPGVVGGDEGVERVHREDGRGHGQGDVAEDLPLGGAVDGGGLVELAGEGVEEAFEDEDGEAVGDGGEDERGEGVEQPKLADEQEARDGRDRGGEGHRGQEEEEDGLGVRQAEAREGVGGQGVDGEGGQDGEQDKDEGVPPGAAAEEEDVADGAVAGGDVAPQEARAGVGEGDGEGLCLGEGHVAPVPGGGGAAEAVAVDGVERPEGAVAGAEEGLPVGLGGGGEEAFVGEGGDEAAPEGGVLVGQEGDVGEVFGGGVAGEAGVVLGRAATPAHVVGPGGARLGREADAEEAAGVGRGDEGAPGGVGVVAGEGGGGEAALGAPALPAGGQEVGARAAVGEGRGAVVGLEVLPQVGLGVVGGPVPIGVMEGDAGLGAEADGVEGVVADVPGAVELGEGGLGALVAGLGLEDGADVGADVALVVGAEGVADVVGAVEVGVVLGHGAPGGCGLGVFHARDPRSGKGADARGVARKGRPVRPEGRGVREDVAGEGGVEGGQDAHEAALGRPDGGEEGGVEVVVEAAGHGAGDHHEEGPDHRDGAEGKDQVDERQDELGAEGLALGGQDDHGRGAGWLTGGVGASWAASRRSAARSAPSSWRA